MWNLFLRSLAFLLLLFLGFGAGWEFLLAGIFFFMIIEKAHWEYLFLGLIFDLAFGFPMRFFFTGIIFLFMVITLLAERFFKSETLFSSLIKAFLISLMAAIVISVIFAAGFWNEPALAMKFGVSSFVKIFLSLSVFLFLFNVGELSRGPKILF